jgi:23S rRNA pseudouridine1911/1915/1917 synthase
VKHSIVGDPIYGVDFRVADDYLNGVLDQKERIKESGASRLLLQANWIEFKYYNRFKLYSKQNLLDHLNI